MDEKKFPLSLEHGDGKCDGKVVITKLWPVDDKLVCACECRKCSEKMANFEIPIFDFLEKYGPTAACASVSPQLYLPLNHKKGFSKKDASYLQQMRISLEEPKQKAES